MKLLLLIPLLLPTLLTAVPPPTPLDKAMRNLAGAAIVLDVQTNKVLASYHAGQIQATPGSTLKPFFLLAALNTNTAPKQVYCRRNLRVATRPMHCVHPAIAHALDAREALAYSCNTYFAELAGRLYAQRGATGVAAILRQRGFDQVRTPDSLPEAQLLALGVEGITSSPLALAEAYRSLALELTRPQAGPADHLVAGALDDSIRYGTANTAALPDLRIAGKTGTASAAQGGPTHGWFAGFAPATHPQIVVVVFLNHGRGSDAAAHAKDIFGSVLKGRGFSPADAPLSKGQGFTSADAPLSKGQDFTSADAPLSKGQDFTSTDAPLSKGQDFTSADAPLSKGRDFTSADAPLSKGQGFTPADAPLSKGRGFSPAVSSLNEMRLQPRREFLPEPQSK